MSTPKGRVTAHVRRVSQDQGNITTLIMSQAQILELMSLLWAFDRNGSLSCFLNCRKV
jgi:hypothetical protein